MEIFAHNHYAINTPNKIVLFLGIIEHLNP